MTSDLNITKGLSSKVTVVLADSREISGRFFLADHARNHYGEETILDLLNRAEKQFVPFDQGNELPVVLIRKSKILGLRPKYSNHEHWPKTDNEDDRCWPLAKIVFAEFSLTGRAYTGDMQPQRRRLADLLNHGNLFFVFEADEGPWIINKNLMDHLEPISPRDED